MQDDQCHGFNMETIRVSSVTLLNICENFYACSSEKKEQEDRKQTHLQDRGGFELFNTKKQLVLESDPLLSSASKSASSDNYTAVFIETHATFLDFLYFQAGV